MASNDTAEHVILTGTAPDGDRIDLVVYRDDRCGLSRNGRPIADRQWSPCRINESALELMRALGLE